MSRKEYMEQLDMLLRDIPHTERQEALKYYEDYFEDAGEEHEADVIEELGKPEKLAKKLREDLKREENEESSKEYEESPKEYEESLKEYEGSPEEESWKVKKAEACPKKSSKKGVNALAVCFIILGILMGIGHLWRIARNIVWLVWDPAENGLVKSVTEGYEAYGENGIRDLEIEAGFGELVIECWDEEKISISYPESYMKVRQDGGGLSLTPRRKWSIFRWFGIWNEEENAYRTVIKIPKDYVFRTANISTGVGTADIERLEAVSLVLETGAGELDAGEVIVEEKAKITAGVGETTIENLQASEAELSVGVGELYIRGMINGDISADCGVGELIMELRNQESDFNYDVSCGVGDVSVNGKDYSGIGTSHDEDNGAEFDFDISCGIGSIEVTLQGIQ